MSAPKLIPLDDAREALKPLAIGELLQMNIPQREMILSPILPAGGLAMLYAPRGIGKTHLALGAAYAVATGTEILRWRAPKTRRVVYLDGEMPLGLLRDRLALIVAGVEGEPLSPDGFTLLAADHHLDGLPNIADDEGQLRLFPTLSAAELVVLDNLSTLARGIRENEADDWAPVQSLMLRLRRAGVAVLLVHHAGRNGQARGTSRREDVLDTVISLRRPDDYVATEGARLEVHLEKARGVFGPEADPFEARLEVIGGAARWHVADVAADQRAEALAMFEAGSKVPAVIDALGASRASVYRWRRDWQAGRG